MVKIVVIEDETPIRDAVMDWLGFEGYETAGAANGRLGLEAIYREIPDMIICDIAMPEMDGHEVLIEVRSDASINHIPFIFLTAAADRASVRKGMDMGADDYLTKPFTRDEILNAVRSRLQKKAAQESQLQAQIGVVSSMLSEEREKRLLKSRLVAMFSHDFRNPLTLILSSLDIIRNYKDWLSPQQIEKHYNRIGGSVHLLLQMLDDMLMVAEMESGHIEYAPQPVDITAFVQAIVEEFRLISGQMYALTFYSDIHAEAHIDPKLLRQMLANLISNAIKYSAPQSEITIALREQGSAVELVVEDRGIGIPQDAMPHLFEPFNRASNAKDVRGTGLGLTIVKQAVDLHGGSIAVESVLGEGTRFVVALPCLDVASAGRQ